MPFRDGQGGEVLDVDRAQAVVAAPKETKHGHAAQRPGDVVDENVLAAKEDGRAQDAVGNSRLAQRRLQARLAREIGQLRFRRRIRDAHVHDALDAGRFRCCE